MMMALLLVQLVGDAVQQQAQNGNSSGIDCKWLLVGACVPMAAVIVGLWRALEKSNASHMETLKDGFKSLKKD